jgi:hypothetical protein
MADLVRPLRPKTSRDDARTAGALALTVALATSIAIQCAHPPAPCPPAALRPRAVAPRAPTDPGVVAAVESAGARYQTCDAANEYLITRPGDREMTDAEIVQTERQLHAALNGQRAISAGTGGCLCRKGGAGDRPGLCIKLWISGAAPAPETIARHTDQALANAGAPHVTARIGVVLSAERGPRCAPGDPDCGPVPYAAACAAQLGYRASERRRPVSDGPSGGPENACSGDGDCEPSLCERSWCVAAKQNHGGCDEHQDSPEEQPKPELKAALCGCVSARCQWFTQPR